MSARVFEVRLERGDSSRRSVQFAEGRTPATRVMVGAGVGSQWIVMAPGVSPQHAEFAWDGAHLWIRDASGGSGVTAADRAVGPDWHMVPAGQRVRIGSAVLAVVLTDDGTEVVEDAALLEEEAPARGFDDVPTQIHDMDPSLLRANAVVATAPSPFDDHATQVTAPSPAPAPAPSHAVATQPPPATATPRVELPPQESRRSGLPSLGSAVPVPQVRPVVQEPVPATETQEPAAVPPPVLGAGRDLTALFGELPPPPPVLTTRQRLAAVPVRTWVLAGITFLAGLGTLSLFLTAPEEQNLAGPAVQERHQNTRPSETFTPAIVVTQPAPPTGFPLAATQTPPPPPPDPRHPAPPPTPEQIAAVPSRAAADLVARGRLTEAVEAYDALARSAPDQPVYAQLAVVLRRKLELQQHPCVPGAGGPCAQNTATGVR